MYGSFTCDVRPHKEEKECTRLTAGGDRINYPDNVGTPTADMTLFKCLANSIISTPGERCIIQRLLFKRTYEMQRIHETQDNRHPRQNHQGVQLTRVCNRRWICILRNQQRHVRHTSSGHHSPRTPQRETFQAWLPPKQDNTWTLDTQNKTHNIHTNCG